MGSSTGNALERLRKEAKRLLKSVQSGDEAAFRRFAPYWPAAGPSGEVRNLARAQLVIARERGYRSWAHLKTSLLGNEERVMSEQKHTVARERRLGVYTYEEAEREAKRQAPVPGYTWVVHEMGLEKTMQSLLDHLP
jgi:hypothetical protein